MAAWDGGIGGGWPRSKAEKSIEFYKVDNWLRPWWRGYFRLTSYSKAERQGIKDFIEENKIKCAFIQGDTKKTFFLKCFGRLWNVMLELDYKYLYPDETRIYVSSKEDAVLVRLGIDDGG